MNEYHKISCKPTNNQQGIQKWTRIAKITSKPTSMKNDQCEYKVLVVNQLIMNND